MMARDMSIDPPRFPDVTVPAQTRVLVSDPDPGTAFDPSSLPMDEERRYRVAEEIGRGGLGRVVAAHDRRLDRPVALKELLRNGADSAARFVREAQLTARLEHPSIVPVHDAGRTPGGVPFYAMKRVHGRPLDALMRDATALGDRLALLPNLIAVAEAIAYAHSQGVIHRDLKPANVLVGAYGETVVIDWGLAKDLRRGGADSGDGQGRDAALEPDSGRLTADGSVLGTPIYMPPEQARGEPVDERADVYALGAILYELFSGEPPFRGASNDVVAAVQSSAPAPLARKCPGLPDDLVSIVDKAMARSKAGRYPTARELAQDLVRFQAGQLVASHSYSRGQLLRRFLVKNRAPLAVAGVLGTLLCALGVISVLRIVDANRVAERERAAAVAGAQASAERTRDLLLLQARDALAHDPTMALGWLKQIHPLEGPRADRGALIAAAALAHGAARRVLRGHKEDVLAVALSRDGALAASGGIDHTVRLWDLATGTGRVLGSLDTQVNAVAFSPDGQWLVAGGEEPTVSVYGVATGSLRRLAGHERGAVNVVAFTDDGTLVTAGEDGVVRLWDLAGGGKRALFGHTGTVYSVAVAPDGKHLASAGDDKTIMLWDLASGDGRRLSGHFATVWSVAFAPDGSALASASDDRTVRVWPSAGGPPRVLVGHDLEVKSVRFVADGKTLVSGGADGMVIAWDLPSGGHRVLHRHQRPIWFTEVSRDGAWLATASWDKTAWLLDLHTGAERLLAGHTQQIIWLDVARDGQTIATASSDGTVRIWPVPAAPEEVQTDEENAIGHVDVSLDGRYLATAGELGVRLWDRGTGRRRLLRGHDGRVVAVRFAPDGKTLASGGVDATVRLWNVATGAATTLAGHERTVNELAFWPDGKKLASASDDQTVRVWDVGQARSIQVLRGHGRQVLGVAVAPDGALLASSSSDKTVRVWNAGEPRTIDVGTTVPSIAFVDRQTLAAAGYDGAVRQIRLDGGAGFGDVRIVAHQDGPVYLVAAGPGGLVAAGGVDRNVQVIAATGVRILDGQRGDIVGLAFGADGHLASTSRDRTLRVWDTGKIPPVPTVGLEAWLLPWPDEQTAIDGAPDSD